MDTYCVVRGGAAHYGGVLGWELTAESFEIRLDPDAAAVLELPRTTRITLAGGHDLEQLRERLKWIIGSV